jgi:hypothetical protein
VEAGEARVLPRGKPAEAGLIRPVQPGEPGW